MSAPAAEAVLFGIPNCDTVKRARAWLADHGVAYRFHDVRKQGVPAGDLANWMAEAGWERVLNRQGTTWRKLDDATKAGVVDPASAAALMQAQPSVIKRPVVRWPGGELTVGFDATEYAQLADGGSSVATGAPTT